LRDRHRDPRAAGPPPGAPVRALGRLRPLRVVPRVPAARPLLHRSGRADRGRAPGGVRRPGDGGRGPDRHGRAGPSLRARGARPGAPLVLSEVLPLLEDLGVTVVDERTHEIRVEGRSVWRYDIGLRVPDPGRIDDRATREEFCSTFASLFRSDLESDGLNRLVL